MYKYNEIFLNILEDIFFRRGFKNNFRIFKFYFVVSLSTVENKVY